jgi:hypothetical protein
VIDDAMRFIDVMEGAIAQTAYGRIILFACDVVVRLVQQFQRAMKAAAAFHLRIDRRMVVQILPVVNRSPLNLVDRSVDLFDGVLFFLIHVIGGGQVFQMSARMPQVGKRVQVRRMPSRFVSEGERGADSHKKRE